MTCISLQHVTKSFQYTHTHPFAALFSSAKYRKEVLHDTSTTVTAGEVVGLIGDNGSGKSTLLKLIAGLYKPTSGYITAPKDTFYLGGASGGFPLRLTVREAIYYIGTLLNLPKHTVEAKYDAILDFAELTPYETYQLYQLSRGMMHRLYFSLVTHLTLLPEPPLVLLDEVFTRGGDIAFRKKTEGTVHEYIARGSTVMFASHNMDLVLRHATRVWWLDGGVIHMDGDAKTVHSAYRNTVELD